MLLSTVVSVMSEKEHIPRTSSDLTDPNKYRDEKIAAGGLVSEACYRYFMGPHMTDSNDREYMQPLVEIVRSAMHAVGDMDVRKELLYALGEPMDLEGDEAIHVMKEQEHFASVNSFLSSLNDLAHTGKIAFALSPSSFQFAYSSKDVMPPFLFLIVFFIFLTAILTTSLLKIYLTSSSILSL